jgi:hypothetical protein
MCVGIRRHHIGAMHLALTDEEAAALIKELHDLVENDPYPFSPCVRTLRAILAKLRPEPVGEPLAAAKSVCATASTAARRHRAGPVARTQKLCNQRRYMHVG